MATVEDALESQLRNIEKSTGRRIHEWTAMIHTSGHARHKEIVAWLKDEHGLTYGNANRLALVALADGKAGAGTAAGGSPAADVAGKGAAGRGAEAPAAPDPLDDLYAGARAHLRPIHERVMRVIDGFGAPIEVAPKKGYVSLRRRTQFGMLKPATRHVDLGLILPNEPVSDRLESAGTWNGMMTHRVRVDSVGDVNTELVVWLHEAWQHRLTAVARRRRRSAAEGPSLQKVVAGFLAAVRASERARARTMSHAQTRTPAMTDWQARAGRAGRQGTPDRVLPPPCCSTTATSSAAGSLPVRPTRHLARRRLPPNLVRDLANGTVLVDEDRRLRPNGTDLGSDRTFAALIEGS